MARGAATRLPSLLLLVVLLAEQLPLRFQKSFSKCYVGLSSLVGLKRRKGGCPWMTPR
jgi:hypothetical protein